jgi:tetratricopeptide (TPR) repeat protein
VYSLGVVLYGMLCEALPYDVSQVSIVEAAKVIQERTPARLSSVNRTLRGDIETIVFKALEKERNRRYKSADALGDDVRRYLRGEPIEAHPPSMMYQLGRFARRNRVLVGGLMAVFVVLVAGMIGTSWALVRALRAEEDARGLLARAEAAEVEATYRAEELEQVARFQAKQLSGIDVNRMGERIREDVVSEARRALEISGLDADAVTERTDRLRETLSVMSFRGVAVSALNETIFDGAIAAIGEDFADQPLVRARLLQSLAATMRAMGLDQRCVDLQTEALAIRRRELGATHPDTIRSLSEGAWLLSQMQRWDEAAGLMRECLDGRRATLGEQDAETLRAMRDLAYFLYGQQKTDEAEQFAQAALDGYTDLLGPDHHETIASISTMAVVVSQRGDDAETERWMRAAYEARLRTLGSDDVATEDAAAALVGPLRAQGKNAEAEEIVRTILASRQRRLGPNHQTTLITCNMLSSVLRNQHKQAEAERYVRIAAEGFLETLGPDHHDTHGAFNSLAVVMMEQKRYDEAAQSLSDLLDQTSVSGRDSYNVAFVEFTLGQVLRELGRYEEAEEMLLQAYEHVIVNTTERPQQRAVSGPMFAGEIVKLYDVWEKPDEAAAWRETVAGFKGSVP